MIYVSDRIDRHFLKIFSLTLFSIKTITSEHLINKFANSKKSSQLTAVVLPVSAT